MNIKSKKSKPSKPAVRLKDLSGKKNPRGGAIAGEYSDKDHK